MTQSIFAINIKGILEDSTEVENVRGFVINKKRVYKLSDGTVLTGNKKIKTFLDTTITIPIEIYSFVMTLEYE
tara:strand:+ start:1082 stop:1300 length:219 start_codon:yes stop_codon:yes gene_type:complete